MLEHPLCKKLTWLLPDSIARTDIDQICISKKWKSSLHDVKSIVSVDIGSHHHLVEAKTRHENTEIEHFNSEKLLASKETAKHFEL